MQFASLLENLGSRTQFVDAGRGLQVLKERILVDGGNATEFAIGLKQQIDSARNQPLAHLHHTIVQRTNILLCSNLKGLLEDDTARVNLMVKEESSGTRNLITIDDCPIEGRCASILWEKSSMQIECAQPRHSPYHFGQHTEGNDNLKVSSPSTQCFEERFVLELFGLKEREIMIECILLDGTILHLVSATSRLVGHCDDTNNIIAARDQRIECVLYII